MIKFSKVFIALALLILTPFFFIGGPAPTATPLFNAVWDCGHIVFFCLLAVLLVQKFSLTRWRAWALITLAVFLLGGAIEVVQAHTGRNGSWQDLLRDLTGVWLGLFFIDARQRWVMLGRALAFGLLSFNLGIVGWCAAGQLYAYQQFPMLADFESPLGMQTMRVNGIKDKPLRNKDGTPIAAGNATANPIKTSMEPSVDFVSSGHQGLKVQLSTQRYSGVAFNQLIRVWSGYKYLAFDLYNPNPTPVLMIIRVSDAQHDAGKNELADRFNRYLNVAPGWNHESISLEDIASAPEHRRMNMDEITSVVIFANRLREPQLMYIDNMRLQK